MSKQTGRNDLCPCGSGQKAKSCHPNGYRKLSGGRIAILAGVVVAGLGIVAATRMGGDAGAPAGGMTPLPQAGTASGGAAPPPGPAPAGKVWSPEHGHWHDAPGTTPQAQTQAVTPGQGARVSTPQPPGPVPEGKVWSAEHGHWHDAPGTPPSPAPDAGAAPAEDPGP